MNVGRIWRLTIISLVAFGLLSLAAVWGGVSLVRQAQSLMGVAADQAGTIADKLAEYGLTTDEDGRPDLLRYLPTPEALFGHAQTAFGLTIGVVGNIVIIVFIGLFFAADPAAYRDSLVRLLPMERRERVRAVLTEAGHALRWWLVGQIAMMILVAISVAAMLLIVGIPNTILLGVIAGLLNFIPFVGPILAGVPVLLASMPEGLPTVLLVMSLFVIIESIEGYLLAPIIQERAVHIPPAWSLAGLVVFGAMFGPMGIALATPLLAALRILVLRLYVEDALGDHRRLPTAS